MAYYKSKVKMEWNGEDVKKLAKEAIEKMLLKKAIYIQMNAVLLAPVDSGRLRGSIFIKSASITKGNDYSDKAQPEDIIPAPTQPLTYYIGTNIRYGSYVCYGTARTPSQPFMRPAIDLSNGEGLETVKKDGREAFKKYLR